jgi:hypothetical protein
MIVKFLGQFLLEKGAITKEDLIRALDYQKENHQRFGTYALRMGYLTVEQLNELYRLQIQKPEKIGELAIQKGYLSHQQVEEILQRQRNDHLMLGEILVKLKIIEREKLYLYLDEYHRITQSENTHLSIENFKEEPLLLYLVELFVSLVYRFSQKRVKPQIPSKINTIEIPLSFAVTRLVSRVKPIRILFGAEKELKTALAKGFFGEDFQINDKALDDAMEEFINILCGNFLGKAVQMGKTWDLEPPLTIQSGEVIIPYYGEYFLEVPFYTPENKCFLYFDIGEEHGASKKEKNL